MSITDQLEVVQPDDAPVAASRAPKKSILQFELTAKKVPRKDLMHFSRQLAVFIKAGIPILDALEAIQEEMGNKFFRSIVQDILAALREGSTFADACQPHSSAFPAYYLGILRSAELTGKLDTVLVQLSEYIERDLEARRKVTSALAYPSVVLGMSVVVVVVLVAFVLPKFEHFFDSLDAELPLPTRMLLGTADFLTSNAIVIVAALIAGLAMLIAALRTQRGKAARDIVLLKLPVLGDLVRHVVLERFCRILSAMMQAGVPLPSAMAVTTDATSNAVFQKGLTEAREAMLRGEGLAAPLIATNLFPPSAKQMFRVGENTGTLDEQLGTAAVYFERELDYKIKRFTSLFEPAVLLFVGVIVGFVAIALVSAMYGIFGQTRDL
ncbi:MAG: type II secretion system F family protein [Mycobacteriales bacterium]|nr:type II secretion system F family protein [Mycobacteriales bacterium]